MTLYSVIISISALAKFSLPAFTPLVLRDSAGLEVDLDIFDELLKVIRGVFQGLHGRRQWKKSL